MLSLSVHLLLVAVVEEAAGLLFIYLPNTQRFKRTLVYLNGDTQYAFFKRALVAGCRGGGGGRSGSGTASLSLAQLSL